MTHDAEAATWSWSASWLKSEAAWSGLGDRELWSTAWQRLAESHRFISRAEITREPGPHGTVVVASWRSGPTEFQEPGAVGLPAAFGAWGKSLDDAWPIAGRLGDVDEPW